MHRSIRSLASLTAIAFCVALVAGSLPAAAKKKADSPDMNQKKDELLAAGTFAGLALRGIGPAVTSGRIVDVAIHPDQPSVWWVASASGGVWKSDNAGTTWTPVFDGQGSYSIGCLAIDPGNPNVVWVGTGENNSQRSVSYGDGVYKTEDGGKTWTDLGLKDSQHIGKIVIDPRDTDVVYVAAQGPLWNAGGDRGLYKTTDGGASWTKVLDISKDTGVTDIAMDPRDPDTLYAASYQRRRRVWTLIDGGPESAIYKSTDAGAHWKKLTNGLPMTDMGRIGLAVAPSEPDVVYATIEAARDAGGLYRSTDRGESWEMRSDYLSSSPQYYQELFVDPQDADRVYSMDTFMMVTDDGGASFHPAGEHDKHVDNHALWIDPENSDHLINGNDGGLYESFDRAQTWTFFPNLPVTQFYKLGLDNAKPFYNVYGGTQDNFSLGGPNETTSTGGIQNEDWYVTAGGDGFQSRVDPTDPNIVYAESQYGNLIRFDRASGEQVDIQPQPDAGEPALRWNWDSPLIISPHSATRLYFAANRLFRSDDRGDTWTPISPDLSKQVDRNQLEVMGRIWSIDSVAKNASTSFYGNIVTLAESPLVENLLYAGTDDGRIQVTGDAGGSWRSIDSFPGVPAGAYVSKIEASKHDPDTVFAAFDAHKDGDFKPYVLESTDRGATWSSIAGDLPEKGTVYALAQDHEDADLLFAGTEFGVFFTPDGGGHWIQLTGGMPTIAVRDLAIQEREDDLVAATFGRGFYVLDDYSPLRSADKETLEKGAVLFPVQDPWMYVEGYSPLGLPGAGFLGSNHFSAPNPPFGAVITYYLKDGLKTKAEQRQKAESDALENDATITIPSWDELRAEHRETDPSVLITVRDADGNVVRRLNGPVSSGFHRVAWDLTFPSSTPVRLNPPMRDNPFGSEPTGPLVAPGTYSVSIATVVDDKITPVGGEQTFTARPLGTATLPAADQQELMSFHRKMAQLQRAVLGASKAADEAADRIAHVRKAILDTPDADASMIEQARDLENRLADLRLQLEGDEVIAGYNEPTPPSINDRIQRAIYGCWGSTSAPTATQKKAVELADTAFRDVLAKLRTLVEVDLTGLENRLEALGAPWTPGRLPTWPPQ